MTTDDLRIVFVPNDGEEYPWPWTAFLQERDGDGWAPADGDSSADGETPAAALDALRGQCAAARDVKVKVPKPMRGSRA